MEASQNCAYNQTRECFLGLEVAAGDFPPSVLNEWMPSLTPKSGAGIWMVPFRGIAAAQTSVPLDLLYLDEECRVLDTVEFFPTYRVSPGSPTPASVLALPTHSIFTSQTQAGDQLVLCAKEEMAWRLEQTGSHDVEMGSAAAADSATRLVGTQNGPSASRQQNAGTVLVDSASSPEPFDSILLPNAHLPRPLMHQPRPITTPPRSWLERWLFPESSDTRRNPRFPAPGLAAHFWTGGAPQPHLVRDISASGLYVVTAERWHPGTMIRMTLSKPESSRPGECSITVQATIVRWGSDGVGLDFVFSSPFKPRLGRSGLLDQVDRDRFDEFLTRLRSTE